MPLFSGSVSYDSIGASTQAMEESDSWSGIRMGLQKRYGAGLRWERWLIGQEELGIMNTLRDCGPDSGPGSFPLGCSGACYAC